MPDCACIKFLGRNADSSIRASSLLSFRSIVFYKSPLPSLRFFVDRCSRRGLYFRTKPAPLSQVYEINLTHWAVCQYLGLASAYSIAAMISSKSKVVGLPLMNLIRTKGLSILQQLHIEERLLRASSNNWCIINDGTNQSNIVMGISGKPIELIKVELVIQDQVPVIRRFSGGGTVIVDDSTIFVTFICNKDAIPLLQPYPRPIMSWTGQLYKNVFEDFGNFQLCENDYAFGLRKFGGNAQSITKNRWIHHTSFLWDYDANSMEYLRIPKRAPEYRLARNHAEFLCRMKDYMTSRSTFIERTISSLEDHFSVRATQLDCAIDTINDASQLHTTKLLTIQELEGAYSSQQRPSLQ